MSRQFWVKTRDKIAGPYTAQQLKELAARSKLHPQHLVSTDQQRWVPADGLKGLAFPSQDKQTSVPAEQIEKQRPSEHSGAPPPLGGTGPLAVLFDIDDLGAGWYGPVAWEIVLAALAPHAEKLAHCTLSEGDTDERIPGRNRPYCWTIAVGCADLSGPSAEQVALITQVLSRSPAKGLMPGRARFQRGQVVATQPLIPLARIDPSGHFVLTEPHFLWLLKVADQAGWKHRIDRSSDCAETFLKDFRKRCTSGLAAGDPEMSTVLARTLAASGGIAVEGALEFALQHEKSDQARRAYQDALKQLRGGAGGENAEVAAKVETCCPHCHRHAKGPSSLVGHEVPCPTCGQPFQFEPLPPSAADAGRDSEPVALGDPFQLDFDETLDERPFECIQERIPQFEPGRLNQWLHSSEKRHDLQGLKLADAAIRAYPDHAVPYVWAAMFLRKLGRHQDAVKCLSRAIRRCKQRTHLYAAMGEVAYETNQLPHMLGWCIRSVIAAWKSGAHIEDKTLLYLAEIAKLCGHRRLVRDILEPPGFSPLGVGFSQEVLQRLRRAHASCSHDRRQRMANWLQRFQIRYAIQRKARNPTVCYHCELPLRQPEKHVVVCPGCVEAALQEQRLRPLVERQIAAGNKPAGQQNQSLLCVACRRTSKKSNEPCPQAGDPCPGCGSRLTVVLGPENQRDFQAAEVFIGTGENRFKAGDLAAALESFRRAQQLFPEHPYLLLDLGYALCESGAQRSERAMLKKGLALLERVLVRDPNFDRAWQFLESGCAKYQKVTGGRYQPFEANTFDQGDPDEDDEEYQLAPVDGDTQYREFDANDDDDEYAFAPDDEGSWFVGDELVDEPFEDAETFEVIEEEASYSETDGRDCYFCGQNEADDAAAVEVPMHRHVGMIFYYSATVSVPRCRECKMNHRMAKVLTVSLASAGASLGALGFIFAVPAGVLAVVIGTIVGAITGSWLGKLNVPYEMKSRSDYHGSPVIGSLIENGWRLGDKPSN